jgi:hypothetical protein
MGRHPDLSDSNAFVKINSLIAVEAAGDLYFAIASR